MKTSLLFLALTLPFTLQAQDPVTIGTIVEVSPKAGTLLIRPDNAPSLPILYSGMDRANLQTATGQVLNIESLAPGMRATVSYLPHGNHLIVSKLQVEATAVSTPQVPSTGPALQLSPTGAGTGLGGDLTKQPGSKAAIDNDITTQPGSKATTDNDITTQPGKKAPGDPDITKQPAR